MNIGGEMVWCVMCIDHDGNGCVHIFSDVFKRQFWVDSQPDTAYSTYIHYDYVIDDPDRMDKPASAAN